MRRILHRPSGFLVGAMLVALGALSVSAQQAPTDESEAPPGPLPGVFGSTIEVRVINLEVVVTDKEGNPVRGLGAEDFRLLVDGEERPIEYFTEIVGGEAGAVAPGVEAESVPAVTPGEPVGTSYLLFVDDYFSIARDRNVVLESLIRDLSYLGPEDRMAVVAWNGREIRMLSTWSQSRPELKRALQRATTRDAFGLQRQMERRNLDVDGIFEAGSSLLDSDSVSRSAFERRLTPVERQFVSRISTQLGQSVAAASAALRGFAMPPGRKVMLLLSGGWPFLPSFYTVGDFTLRSFYEATAEGEPLYQPLVETANRLGFTIYPVDVPGLTATAGGDVTDRTTVQNEVRRNVRYVREQEAHDTLQYLARATGGEPYLNARSQHALQLAFEDTRSYYWLGFTPNREGNDERHEIRVVPRNAEYRVRTREDYLDSSRSYETDSAVESALLFGNPPGTGTLPLELGAPHREGRRLRVPLEAAIPIEVLTVLQQGDRWIAEAEVRIAVIDEDGARAPIPTIPVRYTFEDEPRGGEYVSFQRELELRRKRHEVVVGVSNPVTGEIVTGSGSIQP